MEGSPDAGGAAQAGRGVREALATALLAYAIWLALCAFIVHRLHHAPGLASLCAPKNPVVAGYQLTAARRAVAQAPEYLRFERIAIRVGGALAIAASLMIAFAMWMRGYRSPMLFALVIVFFSGVCFLAIAAPLEFANSRMGFC